MKPQSGARTDLVDPFGRELEEWLRDAPAVRRPYVGDLVVPPVTAPVAFPGVERVEAVPSPVPDEQPSAFRRERGRHVGGCLPSFPEPPERLALRFEVLAVEVSASSGRTVIERIVFFENELRQREDDIARLKAWEDEVSDEQGPEVEAARQYAREVFADILEDAAAEQERRERDALRTAQRATATPLPGSTDQGRVGPAPLVQPATGPTVLDRAAFTEAVRANTGPTATEAAAKVPEEGLAVDRAAGIAGDAPMTDAREPERGWWVRMVAALRRLFVRH